MPISFLRQITGRERTVSANRRLGLSLAGIAGAVNAGGFLAVQQYTSHMTGILSAMADHVVLGKFALLAAGIAALSAFLIGAMTSALLANWARRKRMHSEYALALMLEALMLLLFGLLGANLLHWQAFFAPITVMILCFIMGLQNAIATKLSHAEIRTTHMTGVITDMGIELGKLIYWNRTPGPESSRVVANRQKLKLHASLLLSFFSGAIVGAWGFDRIGFRATLPLSALLMLLALMPVMDDFREHWRRTNRR